MTSPRPKIPKVCEDHSVILLPPWMSHMLRHLLEMKFARVDLIGHESSLLLASGATEGERYEAAISARVLLSLIAFVLCHVV